MNKQPITRCKTNAGLRRTKTASCFFQISGGWTTKEHEIRTGLTAGTLAFMLKRQRYNGTY